jgi:hypothetical protein
MTKSATDSFYSEAHTFLGASASLPKTFKAKSRPPVKSPTPIVQQHKTNAKSTMAKAQ